MILGMTVLESNKSSSFEMLIPIFSDSRKEGVLERCENCVGSWHHVVKHWCIGANSLSLDLSPAFHFKPFLEGLDSTLSLVSVIDTATFWEVKQGRVASDGKLCAKDLTRSCAIYARNIHILLDQIVKLVPLWCQMLAVRAPRSVKLDEPWLVAYEHASVPVNNSAVEIVSCRDEWLSPLLLFYWLLLDWLSREFDVLIFISSFSFSVLDHSIFLFLLHSSDFSLCSIIIHLLKEAVDTFAHGSI